MIDPTINSTFWQAIAAGNVEAVRDALNLHPGLVSATQAGFPAGHTAVRYQQTKVGELLIMRGADLLARDHHGLALLERIAFEGSRRLIDVLFFQMPALRLRLRSRSTLFLWAVAGGNLDVASYLLVCGANRHVCDASGRNAVSWAVLGNQAGMIQWLFQQGVTVQARDIDGYSPADLAEQAKFQGCVKVLVEKGAYATSPTLPQGSPKLSLSAAWSA